MAMTRAVVLHAWGRLKLAPKQTQPQRKTNGISARDLETEDLKGVTFLLK